jgi:hypothetical protein
MLARIEGGKLDSPQFAEARDEFAGKCIAAAAPRQSEFPGHGNV